jgi:hypothetical protein
LKLASTRARIRRGAWADALSYETERPSGNPVPPDGAPTARFRCVERTRERIDPHLNQLRDTSLTDEPASRRDGSQPHRDYSLVLEEDIELASVLPQAERETATRQIKAAVITVRSGAWTPPPIAVARAYGPLMLDGLISRRGRLTYGDAVAIELLGPGDLLRPCDRPAYTRGLEPVAEWQVLQPARLLAVLDARVSAQIIQWPELAITLSGRISRRVSKLNHLLAISHLPRVEDRLLATLRFLAAHCGRVRTDGLTIPINLTHEQLGELVGARREDARIVVELGGGLHVRLTVRQ